MTTAANPGAPGAPGQAAAGDPQPGEPQPGAPAPGDPKPGEAPKPGDPTPGDPKPGEPGDNKPPEKYDLKLADGGVLEQSDVAAFAELARAKGWTNEEAQAALTEHADALKAQGERFLTDLKSHTEIGGEQLAVAQQRANAVLDKFLPADSPEGTVLRSGLNKSGYGNWTPLVLLLSRIGKAMAEDKPLGGGGAPPSKDKKPSEAVLFPSSASPAA